jgi:polysaccharide export outer membrane protein
MQSGIPSFPRLSRACFLSFILLFAVAAQVSPQQKPDEKASGQQTPAAGPPSAAQPISQVAIGTAGAKPEAVEATRDATTANSSTSTAESTPLKLGAGDLVEVNVYGVPELGTKARVGNSGDVYLPLIDYVHVADLTVEEAQALIAKRLGDGGFVRNPHVTIFLDESASQGVTVLGEVSRPGIYPDLGDHKLYEIISEAGGFTAGAARKVSIVRRNVAQTMQLTLPRNLGDDLTNNVEVLPGDTIIVPRAPIIYVVGDVGRPSGLLVDNGTLTVLQAIALAGGPNHTAKLSAVRIIHKTPNGMTESRVPLKKMLEAKAPDVTLQADDILFVPVSGGKVLASRSFDAAMQAATAVTIYTVHP